MLCNWNPGYAASTFSVDDALIISGVITNSVKYRGGWQKGVRIYSKIYGAFTLR